MLETEAAAAKPDNQRRALWAVSRGWRNPCEVAFLGRSNVGKSSLLNSLVKQPGLAFTSARPGCTQLINFYRIDDDLHFVDLPGYGYARVSLDERARWKGLIESYLLARRALALSFLILDARRGWMDMDLELKAWLEFHNRRYQVIVTKIDKLKSNNQLKAGLGCDPERIDGSAATAVLGPRWPGSEGNLANHLEDQEPEVNPGASKETQREATRDKRGRQIRSRRRTSENSRGKRNPRR